jgi:hypothetical protein
VAPSEADTTTAAATTGEAHEHAVEGTIALSEAGTATAAATT